MLMDWTEIVKKYRLADRVTGVVHVGAHLAEEADRYAQLQLPVWWIEANTAVRDKIIEAIAPYEDQRLIQALITDQDDDHRVFNITNYDGMSSSVFEFGTHPTFSPDTVFVETRSMLTRTLDSLVRQFKIKGCNFLNMDLQGAEGLALRGGQELLKSIDFVMTEVNTAEVYKGCVQLPELDQLLSDFQRVETFMVPNQGWGDGLYARKGLR